MRIESKKIQNKKGGENREKKRKQENVEKILPYPLVPSKKGKQK